MVNLGDWISTQRQSYKSTKETRMTLEQIKKLEDIGMRLMTSFVDKKLQAEEINKKFIGSDEDNGLKNEKKR